MSSMLNALEIPIAKDVPAPPVVDNEDLLEEVTIDHRIVKRLSILHRNTNRYMYLVQRCRAQVANSTLIKVTKVLDELATKFSSDINPILVENFETPILGMYDGKHVEIKRKAFLKPQNLRLTSKDYEEVKLTHPDAIQALKRACDKKYGKRATGEFIPTIFSQKDVDDTFEPSKDAEEKKSKKRVEKKADKKPDEKVSSKSSKKVVSKPSKVTKVSAETVPEAVPVPAPNPSAKKEQRKLELQEASAPVVAAAESVQVITKEAVEFIDISKLASQLSAAPSAEVHEEQRAELPSPAKEIVQVDPSVNQEHEEKAEDNHRDAVEFNQEQNDIDSQYYAAESIAELQLLQAKSQPSSPREVSVRDFLMQTEEQEGNPYYEWIKTFESDNVASKTPIESVAPVVSEVPLPPVAPKAVPEAVPVNGMVGHAEESSAVAPAIPENCVDESPVQVQVSSRVDAMDVDVPSETPSKKKKERKNGKRRASKHNYENDPNPSDEEGAPRSVHRNKKHKSTSSKDKPTTKKDRKKEKKRAKKTKTSQ